MTTNISTAVKKATGLALGAMLLLNASDAAAAIEGRWEYIPSVNLTTTIAHGTWPNHTRRVIPTENYVYLLVHTHPYNAGSKRDVWNQPHAVLLRVPTVEEGNSDKKVEFETVGNLPGVSGHLVSTAEYNVKGGCLMVAYENGDIDLIHDDGRIDNLLDFRSRNVPGQNIITSIRFSLDGRTAYCAGLFGFAAINLENGRVENICLTPKPVSVAFRLGDEILVANESLLYSAPVEKAWLSFSNFSPVKVTEGHAWFNDTNEDNLTNYRLRCFAEDGEQLNAPVSIYPLNEDTAVAAMLQPKSGTQTVIGLARDGEGEWNIVRLREIYAPTEAATIAQYAPLEGYQSVTREGVTFGSNNFLLAVNSEPHIDFTVENPARDYRNRASRDIMLDVEKDENGREGNKYQRSGTLDNEAVWFYTPFLGWKARHYDGESKTWSDLTSICRPNLPETGFTVNLAYDDRYGLMVRQTGMALQTSVGFQDDADVMQFRRNGVWEDRSLLRSYPEAKAGYSGALGVLVDPFDSRYIYSGSCTSGVARINVEDPDDHVFFSFRGDKSKQQNLDGFIEAFPENQNFNTVAKVMRPVFDAKGNLFFLYQEFDRAQQNLMLWKRSDIAACGDLKNNPSAFQGFSAFEVESTGNGTDRLFSFPISERQGGLILATDDKVRGFWFGRYDYDNIEGSLSWESVEHEAVDQDGAPMEFYQIVDVAYDAERQRLWLGHNEGLEWIAVEDLDQGRHRLNRVRIISEKGSSTDRMPFLNVRIAGLCLDEAGRLWCSLAGNGVACFNPDANSLDFTFNSSNSPLDTDEVASMAWDRSTHSLVASTRGGLYEYTPAEYLPAESVGSVKIWPEAVAPDFTGWVTIVGVPDGMELALRDSSGREVLELPHAAGGSVQWDGSAADGARIGEGRYSIVRRGTDVVLGEVTVY